MADREFQVGDKVYILFSWGGIPEKTYEIESISPKRGDISVKDWPKKFNKEGREIIKHYRGDRIILWTPEREQEYIVEKEKNELSWKIEKQIDELHNSRRFRNLPIDRLREINMILGEYPFVEKPVEEIKTTV